ncbi:MAG: gamma-glutamyl-gamma-aminobutyrate hydrolase family protein, partial [Candidatus Aminicenantales bacterium]
LDLTVVFHLLGGLQDERFPAFLEKHMGFPVLGICLGMQSLNVGTGGTLVQDIWSEVYNTPFLEDILKLPQQAWHTNPYARLYPGERLRRSHMHPIRLLPQGKFVREWGFSKADTPYVYSSHHQAAERLGKGWTLIATSMDGRVPEAFAHTQYPNVLGIQFHPEKPSLWDPEAKSRLAPDEPEPKSLRTILETTPASLAFHKKIWEWFSRALRQWHQEKGASSSVRTESQRTVNLNF